MGQKRIIGIALVRNEDIYIERALRNAAPFCDRLIVADNGSTDATASIVKKLSHEDPRIEYMPISGPGQSQDLIREYAGTESWIFGVDGDEIYDPAGLLKLREDLLDDKYNEWWQVFGNTLNCVELDMERGTASGYLAPPSRSMTKLYNFSAIIAWNGRCVERLHGGDIKFKDGYSESKRLNMHLETAWDLSPCRCLHTCFLRRSSADPTTDYFRENIMEITAKGWRDRFREWAPWSRNKKVEPYGYKREKYMRGDLVELDVSSFFI